MTAKRPLILISNDDGFQAKGINELVDMLRDMAIIRIYYHPQQDDKNDQQADHHVFQGVANRQFLCRCRQE